MPETPQRPNILCIMSDEHDPAVTGCYGDPIVRTPNLDRLAADGITFDAAYTPSPLCVPARLSFTAGKYVSRVGAWSNNCRLPSDDMPSLPRLLRAVGYDALLAGKMHYDRDRRYGFEELFLSPHNTSRKDGRGRRRRPGDEDPNRNSWLNRSQDFHVGEVNRHLDDDREVTRACREVIQTRRPDDRPFFLLAGYIAPHFPLIVPKEYHDRYAGRVPMPAVPDRYLREMPENYRHLRLGFGLTETDPETVKLGRELYWAYVDWMDEQIGQVLDALDDSAVADNTLVVYTSDHGENKGDHATWWKNNMYEHSARVPLIVSWPARWTGGQRRTQACSLLDLVQTFAELAGAETPDDWDGDSMLRWMDDPGADWKDLAASEYYAHNTATGFAMIRRGRWKYVYHTPGEGQPAQRELYDLQADPAEYDNLAAAPAQADRVSQLHRQLVEEIGEDPDRTEQRCLADYAAGYDR